MLTVCMGFINIMVLNVTQDSNIDANLRTNRRCHGQKIHINIRTVGIVIAHMEFHRTIKQILSTTDLNVTSN